MVVGLAEQDPWHHDRHLTWAMIAPTGDKYYFAALLFHGDACYYIDFTPTEGSRDELNTSNTIKVTAGH